MVYLTIAEIQAYTGATYTAGQQTLLTAIEAAFVDFIHKYCNRRWVAASYQEKYDGGTSLDYLNNGREKSNTTIDFVKVDGEAVTVGQEVFSYGNFIKFISPTTAGAQRVEIKYTVTANLPSDIRQALIKWVTDEYGKQGAGGGATTDVGEVRRVSVGPVSVEYGSQAETEGSQTSSSTGLLSGVPEDVADVLRLHRREPL